MKKYFILLFFAGLVIHLDAQNTSRKFINVAVLNTQTDLPFSKFAGMFYKAFHPGIEFTYGKNFSVKQRHDWYYDFRLAYFYHRFVQHGLPVYSNLGYRYKFKKSFSVSAEAGAGYLHSIPATAKLHLDNNGEYVNDKGIGRVQANVCFGIGAGYILHPASPTPFKLFINYQQRLQMPFVKSYVPILPYNSFLIGVSKPIPGKNK